MEDSIQDVRYQVLTAAIMNEAAFWDSAPCSLVVYSSETTRHCIPEGSVLNTQDLKISHKIVFKLAKVVFN
jgi:hypothetical protein